MNEIMKPMYPYQPFIEITVKDLHEIFYDRAFIDIDKIVEATIDRAHIVELLYKLSLKLGYPIQKDKFTLAVGIGRLDSMSANISIDTQNDIMGIVVFDFVVKGMGEPELLNNSDQLFIGAYTPQIIVINEYKNEHEIPESSVSIMVNSDNEQELKTNNLNWVLYHINNFMIRGYRVLAEDKSSLGKRLCRYMIDCKYNNMVIYTENQNEFDRNKVQVQPLAAFAKEIDGSIDAEKAMLKQATHILDVNNVRLDLKEFLKKN